MTIEVANVGLTQTFGEWLTVTNQLADAMTNQVVTVNSNTAVGNAAITGTFGADTLTTNNVTSSTGVITVSAANVVIANTAAILADGLLRARGDFRVDTLSKFQVLPLPTNANLVFLCANVATGNLYMAEILIPFDKLTDANTSNIAPGSRDAETILKWNVAQQKWQANTLSLINSTRINTLNVGTVSSVLTVTANANIGSGTLFVNTTNGRVGVGTVSPSSTLSVNGTITATGDIAAYQTSDQQFKMNIKELEPWRALAKILDVKIKSYDWNEEALKDAKFASPDLKGSEVGVIAQEIIEVLPELVAERPDGSLSVNYEKLVPYLVASIQQLKAELDQVNRYVQRYGGVYGG
jgi:hypothetical protein